MQRQYYSTDHTMQIIREALADLRYTGTLRNAQYTKSKRCSKKTAAMLLERDDDNPGRLTAIQRETLEARAGKQYRRRDPYEKRANENTSEYAARINKLIRG